MKTLFLFCLLASLTGVLASCASDSAPTTTTSTTTEETTTVRPASH